MVRTQLYLTEEQHQQASRAAAESGLTLSEIARQALDDYLLRRRRQRRDFLISLQQASGIWRNRTDISEVSDMRRNG